MRKVPALKHSNLLLVELSYDFTKVPMIPASAIPKLMSNYHITKIYQRGVIKVFGKYFYCAKVISFGHRVLMAWAPSIQNWFTLYEEK